MVTISLMVLILAIIYGIFQTSYVQKIVIKELTSTISKSIDANVSIGRVKFSFFSKVVLDDFYLSDQNKDTLLYTHKLVAGIDTFSFSRKNIHFRSISLYNPIVHVEKYKDNNYNFSFLFGDNIPDLKNQWKANSSIIGVKNGEFFYKDTTLSHEVQALMHLQEIEFLLDKVNLNGGNNFSFNLINLKFRCEDGLEIKELSTGFQYTDSTLFMNWVKGSTANSIVKIDSLSVDLKQFLKSENIFDLKFDFLINQMKLDYKDFSLLFPKYKGDGFIAEMSGRLYGKPGEIKGKNFKANLGDLTRVNGDFYINGLPDIENTYIFINLHESFANLNQLRNFKLPEKFLQLKTKLPKFLDNVGVFSYRGNFTGFLNDFVAYGTAYSNLGSIESDISFKPDKNNALEVHGRLTTKNLRIGSIFNTEHLGRLTLRGDIDGMIKDTLYNLTFNGLVDTIDVNNYKYQRITVKGNIRNKLFDGAFSINDPNLKLSFTGNLDLLPSMPVFKFRSEITYADLHMLNVTKDSVSKISGIINANFEGNTIDNMQGKIEVEQLRYKNSKDILFLEKATINNMILGENSVLSVKSDWFDADFKGQYRFLKLKNSLIRFYQYYLPSSYFALTNADTTFNDFHFVINVKNTEPLARVFAPNLSMESPFTIIGHYNEIDNGATLETVLPTIKYGGREAKNLAVKLNATPDNICCTINSDNISLAKNIQLQEFRINSEGKDDRLGVTVSWKNKGVKKSMGEIKTVTTFEKGDNQYPHIVVEFSPSTFYIADSLWNINASSIEIDSTSLKMNDILVKSHEQKFLLDGKINENSESTVNVGLKNIDFHLINLLIGGAGFNGILSGKIEATDLYQQKRINLDLILANLAYEGAILGDLELKSKWNSGIEKLVSTVSLKEQGKLLIDGAGLIDPINNFVDLNLDFNETPTTLLEVLVPFLFYDMEGNVDGNVHISGKTSHLLFDGKLTPETRIGIGINFLKTHYYFSDPVVFNGDSIVFNFMKFEDELGNKGILNGSIKHLNFMNMSYDLNITTDKIQALNTTFADNDRFYGTAIASGFLSITGMGSEILMDGDFRSEKGTSINIPLERKNTVEKYDFIRFVNTQVNKQQPIEYKLVSNGLNMNFDIDVTPDAKVQLIFNSQIGDIIKGEGNGNLQVKVDKDYNIKLYGDYTIEKGDYLFTLENIINKRFTINRGGTIKWIGDPYDAQIDITAVYKVKTSLYDLFAGSNQNLDLVRRLPVDCTIKLSESLMQPAIDFKIELPTAEENIKDELNRLIVTKEDVNKQMISLLMLGRFYTPEFFGGKASTETGTALMGATASELFSNQLSNWLSQISDQWDIGVNYRPGNEISNDQIELALSTQILNDRITIDGNIANNSNPSAKNSGELVGDFDIKIKLTKDGRLQFKAFNHSNDNLIYDTAPYTQGIGFSYREEFNTLRELFNQYKEALLKKKKNEENPKNDP